MGAFLRGSDFGDGRLDLELEKALAALGRGAPRIAERSVGVGARSLEADAVRRHRHELGGIADAGVGADVGRCLALAREPGVAAVVSVVAPRR